VDGGTSATPHVMFTLVGRFKGEQGGRHQLMPVAAITGSGLEVRKWTERLPSIIDANNRWRKVERAKGKMQSQSIRDRYVEVLKALRQQLKFSQGI
jgi:hypothetical protein